MLRRNKMEFVETKEIETSKIKHCKFPARTDKEEKEDMDNLSSSTQKYLINPISVRIINDNDKEKYEYEIMSGERRLQSFVNNGKDKIKAEIYDNVSDIEAMMFTFKENVQRKNVSINDRDRYIYNMWIAGKWNEDTKVGFKYIKDLAKSIDMNENTVVQIISAGEEKTKLNNTVIQNATTYDLKKTRPLVEYPDLREKLLEKEQKKEITAEEMETMSKKIKESLDNGIDKNIIKNVIDTTSKKDNRVEQPKNVITVNNLHAQAHVPINRVEQPKKSINLEQFGDVLDTLRNSPIDVQEKLAKGTITVETAKEINKFETKEQRDKIAKELRDEDYVKTKKIEKIDTKTKEKIDYKIRDLQDKAQKLKENPDIVFDNTRYMNTPEEHDKQYIEAFSDITRDTSIFNSTMKIKNIKTDLGKEHAIKCATMNYNIWRTVLINAGAIIKSDVIKTDFDVIDIVNSN